MLKLVLVIFTCAISVSCNLDPAEDKKTNEVDQLHDGDLIFQISTSGQGRAIQLATHSPYTHCGIIFREGDQAYVYEAVQPVKKTTLGEWIRHGTDGHFEVKRLKNASQILDDNLITAMKQIANSMRGKDYDLTFGWDDDKLYCSEYVYKIYHRAAGVEI